MEKYLENLKTEWLNEENSDFSGWDFSHITPLRAFLLPERSANLAHSDADDAGFVFDLTHERAAVEKAGFEVLAAAEQYPKSKFFDVGAIVWYCRVVVWEFPGFSVEKCLDKLVELQKRLERDRYIANREHRFMLMLRKL